MTASYDYYDLKYPHEGLKGGFVCKTVPHITLKSIANNADIDEIYELLHPEIEQALEELNRTLTLALSQREREEEATGREKGEREEEATGREKGEREEEAAGREKGEREEEAAGREKREKAAQTNPLPSGEGGRRPGEGKKALDPKLLKLAQKLRTEQTDAEQLFWQLLRNRQFCGMKFRRQHPVAPYVLDFYCHEERLGIELDGGQHNEPDRRRADEERTTFLKSKGIRIIRFWNNEVLRETEAVLEQLYNALTPTPLPRGEGLQTNPHSGGEGGGENPLPSGEGGPERSEGPGEGLKEWQVPFDFPEDWPEAAHIPFDAFHTARQSMQKKMDASIAAHADQEILYDQPQVSKNRLRITGPFTVEAVPFPYRIGSGRSGAAGQF